MNTPTAVATYVFGFVVVVLIALVIRRMLAWTPIAMGSRIWLNSA